AARRAGAERRGVALDPPPPTTALGALVAHITGGHLAGGSFQPMNINYGLLPPLETPDTAPRPKGRGERGRARKRAMSIRALNDIDAWLGQSVRAAAE